MSRRSKTYEAGPAVKKGMEQFRDEVAIYKEHISISDFTESRYALCVYEKFCSGQKQDTYRLLLI